jgi:hypothetical protein
MDRFIFSCVAVAMAGLGSWMAVWPAWIVVQSRDGGDNRPVTGGEIWATRVAGAAIVIGCGYGLYALLTGVPGVDGAP